LVKKQIRLHFKSILTGLKINRSPSKCFISTQI
jgi:hypothetical protein